MDLVRSEVTTEPLWSADDQENSLSREKRWYTSSGPEGFEQKCLLTCTFESGCRDLNPGPLDPQSSALTKLRHSPRVVTAP
jgi:hypothetical protein